MFWQPWLVVYRPVHVSQQRGYLRDGKDRQHPVTDPYDTTDSIAFSPPQLWSNPGTMTWYASMDTEISGGAYGNYQPRQAVLRRA